MKKIYFFILFLSVCLCSCNQEIVYSCNESIDEWVHENLSEIRLMSRSEWNCLEEEIKIPVYRAFTNQQRVDFWNERITDILALEWSKEEKSHINLLLKFICEHQYFLDGYKLMSDDEKNVFDLFFYRWIDKAKIDFKWSDKILYSILASGNTLLDTKGTLATTARQFGSRAATLASTESKCNCSKSSDWCMSSSASYSCEDKPCDDDTLIGCGTLLNYDCDGRCGDI